MMSRQDYRVKALEKIAASPIFITTPTPVYRTNPAYTTGDSTSSGLGDGRFALRVGNPKNLWNQVVSWFTKKKPKFEEGVGTITSKNDDYDRPHVDLKHPDVPIYYVISGAGEGKEKIGGKEYQDILNAAPPGHVQMYRWQDHDRLLKDIYANPTNQLISLLGMSYGGTTALDITNALKKKGYRVHTLDTIDPVGTEPGGGWGLVSLLPFVGNRSVNEKPSNVGDYRNINGDDPLIGNGASRANWMARLGGKVRVNPKFNNGEAYTNLVRFSKSHVLSHNQTWWGYQEVIEQRERQRLAALRALANAKSKSQIQEKRSIVQLPQQQADGLKTGVQFPSNLISSVSFAEPQLTDRQAP